MEAANFHGWNDHFKSFFAGGADGGTEQLNVLEHCDERLIEAEVAHGASNLPILNEKQAVAGHAGHDFFIGIDFADVPETRNEQAAFGGGDHLFYGRISAAEDEIHGRFAVFVGKGKPVPGGLLVRRFGGGPGIHEILGDAAVHEHDALTWHSFAIEWGALLQRMINVVGDADVLAEELLAHAFVQAGALVRQGSGRKIVKKKTDKVENGSGFEDDRVAAGIKLARIDGEMRFFADSGGEFLLVEGAYINGVGFGPACGRTFLHGDRKLGVRFAIGGKEAARICQGGLTLAVREDSGGDLTLLDGQVTGAANGTGSIFSGERGRLFDETVYAAIALLARHRQEVGDFRLAVREGERGFDRGAERVFVEAIRRGARGSPVGDGANRNREAVLGDILVDGVVSKTGQRVGNFVDVDFGFFGCRGFRQTKDCVSDAAKFVLSEKLGGGCPGLL